MTRLNWLLMLAAMTLLACPPPVNLPDGGDDSTIVVPKGGSGTYIRSACSLIVPAGAFDDETVITVTRVTASIPPVPDRTRVSDGCRLSPAALNVKVPLTIIMTWDAGAIPPGVDVQTLDIRRQQGSEAYAQLPGTQVSLADSIIPFDRVTAQTNKLGIFWVTSPSQPNVDHVELEPASLNLNVGETGQFTANVIAPNGATVNVPVSWSAAPPRVASVDGGSVTALDPGTATITVTIPGTAPPQTATAKVYVHGDTVGPVSFETQNPFPTNNDLRGGTFSPLGAVYAGGNGTILVENAGSFTRAASFPLMTFNAVAGTSLSNAVAVGQLLTPQGPQGLFVELKNGAPSARTFTTLQISNLTQLTFDGTHGLAIGGNGDNNALMYTSDAGWQLTGNPTWQKVLSVAGDSAGAFTVLGDHGGLYRWNPATQVWDSLWDTDLTVILAAGKVIDTTGEAYAVGGNRLWHFDGTSWVSENLPVSPKFSSINALGVFDGYVFVGGEADAPVSGRGVVLMRAVGDTTWTSFELRGQQVPLNFFSSGTDARLIGTLGAVWKWNSATHNFAELSKGFQGDVADLAVTATDTFAAVNECVDAKCTARAGVVMHRGTNGFEPLGSLGSVPPAIAIVARTDDEVVISTTGGLWSWNGIAWNTVPVDPGQVVVNDLVWCDDVLWAVGAAGGVYSGDALALALRSRVSGGGDLYSLTCANGEFWAAGTQMLANGANGTGWTLRSNPDVDSDWRAVWSPGRGEAITFGDRLFGGYWDTAALQELDGDPRVMMDVGTAMWGDQIDNLYLTGFARPEFNGVGFMQRYDGITWTLIDSGSEKRGNALFGRSTNEIWLGTNGGGILKSIAP